MIIAIVLIVIIFICLAVSGTVSSGDENATIRVSDENRVYTSATGTSVDDALKKLFAKLYGQVESLAKPESIEKRIDWMQSALNQQGDLVSNKTFTYCADLLDQARAKHRQLIDKENRRKKEERWRKEEERWRKEEERRRKEEENRKSVEKQCIRQVGSSAHKRMIAEQRRLMTDSLRYDILVRDGFRCKICGASAADGVKLHVDHILPVSKGGKTVESNLRTLCERCNLGKSNKIESVPVPVMQTQRADSNTKCPEIKSIEKQDLSISEAAQLLSASGIRCIDNTDRGGCFWIELTPKSEALLNGKTIDGKKAYIAKKSKAFENAPALYVK